MRIRAITAAWRDWHVGHWLTVALPSLLSEGNLPEFCKHHALIYEIFTTQQDADRIVASRAFSLLEETVQIEINILDEASIREPIATHHRIWNQAVEKGRSQNEIVFFIPPDTVWADGSLASLARRLAQGKRVLFNTYLRTNSETFVPALLRRFASSGGRLHAPPREMVDLALQHLHPLMSCYLLEGRHLPEHAEFLLWPVPGEGLLLRLFARELFCFEPSRVSLTDQALLAQLPDPEQMHLFTDSDEFCAVSLTPPWKDSSWYRQPRMLDPVRIAAWWLVYDSPVNDLLCSQPIRFHRGIRDEAAWTVAQEQSDAVVQRTLVSRNVLRICRALRVAGMSQSALLLATALLDLELAASWNPPFTLFLPTNQGFQKHPDWRFQHLLTDWDGHRLRHFIGTHAAPGLVELGRPWSAQSPALDRTSLESRLGRSLEVDASCDPPRIGAARVMGHSFDVEGVRIYPIDGPLNFGS